MFRYDTHTEQKPGHYSVVM